MEQSYSHIGNKRKKEHGFLVSVNKAITTYCKKNRIERTDFAIKIGLASEGSLLNKLKRSREDTDITVTELIHIMEITNNYQPMKYINEMFGFVMTSSEPDEQVSYEQLNQIADEAQIESNEFFATTKKANSDKKISIEEKENMIKDGMEALEKIKEQLEAIRNIKPYDLEEDEDE